LYVAIMGKFVGGLPDRDTAGGYEPFYDEEE